MEAEMKKKDKAENKTEKERSQFVLQKIKIKMKKGKEAGNESI